MSYRCSYGCPPGKRSKVSRRFPSPHKYPKQFEDWFKFIPNIDKENFDFSKHRICDRHFEECDKYPITKRIRRGAVPKLFLPGQISPHFPSADSFCIDLPTSSDLMLSEGAGCLVNNPTEDDVASSSWGSLVDEELIPYSEEVYYVSDHIEETTRHIHHLPKTACTIQSLVGTEEVEDIMNDELFKLSALTPARRIVSEHNYFVSGPCQELKEKRSKRSMLSPKYKKLASKVRSLRRTVRNMRKGSVSLQTRLDEAERWLLESEKLTKPAKVFCKMQFTQTHKKLRGRRFTFDEKLLCLSIYKRGPKVYNTLLYKLFTLPSPKSLKKLLAQVKLCPGIDNHILFKNLKNEANLSAPEDRLCSLIFDEMSITPQLHFNPFKDELKGLDTNGNKFATHALVFMIKTIRKRFKQPVAFYFTSTLNKFDLKKYIIDVITKVHETGYIIVCTVCDQSATNVAAINSLVADSRAELLRNNREMKRDHFFVNSKKIIPLYDTPHLIKGLRNNLITKKLKFFDFIDNEEKVIEWNFFQQLYWADVNYGDPSCRIAFAITEEHINPLKMNKMRVKLATQLFSKHMATCAQHLVDKGEVPIECINVKNFCNTVDDLFDSLNASSFQGAQGKPFSAVVKRNSQHHIFWKKSIRFLKSFRFIRENGEEFVPPSVKNFIKTIEGFQCIWLLLSRKYSFDCLFTRNINQDPVENFFGNIRSYGARNVAPNCLAFEGAYKALLLNNYCTPQSRRTNCEQDADTYLLPNLRVYFDENNVDDIPDTSYVPREKDHIVLIDDIVNTFDQVTVKDDGPISYVCGWVVRKCLKKIIKQCKDCRSDILCSKDNEINPFFKIKEYHPDKKWLCYPSPETVECFKHIQKLCDSYLKSDITSSGLKFKIKSYINIFVEFPFKCESHKEDLINFFIDTSLNFFIHTWCRNINRILSGRITRIDETDPLQVMAQEYYNKHKHYGSK